MPIKVLKLDLDGKNGLDVFLQRMWIIKYLGLRVEDVKVYDTINGYHLYLYCNNAIDDLRAVLFQALLGDDYRRALCNYLKIVHGSTNWNVLFKAKYKINQLGERIKVSEEKFNPELTNKIKDLIFLGE
ncbi:MAG: hypothetical protein ACP6IU_13040 [Candidatus Asgardarchaeia archaeon]